MTTGRNWLPADWRDWPTCIYCGGEGDERQEACPVCEGDGIVPPDGHDQATS